ncbi:MAG: GGDEF domain-containing protein [Pseudolabrys sp.]|nr:GGDEF domain-containing protein [Pseudolabrys sp.]
MGANVPERVDDIGLAMAPVASLRAEIAELRRDLARAERKIAELEAGADIDPMLDILNRRGFERELARSLAFVRRYGTPAALMFIDLDGFKAVNDRHGHAAGDVLLKAVAADLSAHVRASDLVGRLGGDEFAVLMWKVDEARAAAKAAELEAVIGQVRAVYGQAGHEQAELSVGASAGVAALRPDASTAAVIDAADRAMYARKRERKGLAVTQ